MAKSLKRVNGSRKLVNKRRKSLKTCNGSRKSVKRGKGSRKSVKRGKGSRKMYGGTPLTDFLINNNRGLKEDEKAQLIELLRIKSLINMPHEQGKYKGFTPLHILCSLDILNPPMVKVLINLGANVNATIDNYEDNGLTPLDVLIDFQSNRQWNTKEFKEIMTLLLENGGSYNEGLIDKALLFIDEKKKYIEEIQTDIKKQEEYKTISDRETLNPIHDE